MSENLVYVGRVTDLLSIPNADRILSATVVCGKGGKWKGVVKKDDYNIGDLCLVYLPDSIVPPLEEFEFLKSSGYRVKMRRFRGAPSEVVIMKCFSWDLVGLDVTLGCQVTKYNKPIPPHLAGLAKGNFPSFIPKTDEPNYQRHPELVESLIGQSFYITEKCDGSSTTAYKYKNEFGVCSRNLELQRNEDNGYWKIALQYDLENKLPDGIALQWETCGPGIQSNPMGLSQISGFAFSAYDIINQCYLEMDEFFILLDKLHFPHCHIENMGHEFPYALSAQEIELDKIGEGIYPNGNQREGVVIRSMKNIDGNRPISFKAINLRYED